MKTILLKALGVKGDWVYVAKVLIEMVTAQEQVQPLEPSQSVGPIKLMRVLERLKDAVSKVFGIEKYWPAIRTAAIKAIAANKEFYNVVRDAIDAAKGGK